MNRLRVNIDNLCNIDLNRKEMLYNSDGVHEPETIIRKSGHYCFELALPDMTQVC